MANNRMYLFNTRTKQSVYLAKYYPSTGWYLNCKGGEVEETMSNAFHQADFGELTPEQEAANARHVGFGVPFPSDSREVEGAEWEIRYEYHPTDKSKELDPDVDDDA